MTLEEAYLACARERYSRKDLKACQDVKLAQGGAWVAMEIFIPSWVLGMGYSLDLRSVWEAAADPDQVAAMKETPGRYALWDQNDPETRPLLAEQVEGLLDELLS